MGDYYLEHTARRKHKYLYKVGEGRNALYFYTEQLYQAYLKKKAGSQNIHAREKLVGEGSSTAAKGRKVETSSAVGNKNTNVSIKNLNGNTKESALTEIGRQILLRLSKK